MSTELIDGREIPKYGHTELIDGKEIPKPLTKKDHAIIQAYLVRYLGSALPSGYLALPELNVLCGRDRMVPDITVVRRDAKYVEGDLAGPALLAIEIISPGQTFAALVNRCGRLLEAGTGEYWIISPERRMLWTYGRGQQLSRADLVYLCLPEKRIVVGAADLWNELD